MRTFLDFETIYKQLEGNFDGLLDELEEKLAEVEDGSYYQRKILTGSEPPPETGNEGDIYIQWFD